MKLKFPLIPAVFVLSLFMASCEKETTPLPGAEPQRSDASFLQELEAVNQEFIRQQEGENQVQLINYILKAYKVASADYKGAKAGYEWGRANGYSKNESRAIGAVNAVVCSAFAYLASNALNMTTPSGALDTPKLTGVTLADLPSSGTHDPNDMGAMHNELMVDVFHNWSSVSTNNVINHQNLYDHCAAYVQTNYGYTFMTAVETNTLQLMADMETSYVPIDPSNYNTVLTSLYNDGYLTVNTQNALSSFAGAFFTCNSIADVITLCDANEAIVLASSMTQDEKDGLIHAFSTAEYSAAYWWAAVNMP